MAFCPNINSQEVKQVFNGIVTMFEGAPLTDAEFKSVEERAKRTGTDKEAMDIAYYTWDKFKGENIPETKEEILQSIVEESYIKPGVSELFESNPELANAVYEAMGLTTINESEITWTDEEGNPCAKMGGRSYKFTKGSQWEIVKDLKGYPSHAQGGVDIKIGKNGVSFTRNNGIIEAKHGLVLPKIK